MKQDNPLMAHQSSSESDDQIPSQPLDSKSNHPHPSKDHVNMEQQQQEGLSNDDDDRDKDVTTQEDPFASNTLLCINKEEIALEAKDVVAEDSGRERLKRHRVEVAGRVWIPEIWGQEDLLKDWIDCTAFDASLVPSRITTARAALVEEDNRTRVSAAGLRIENRC